MDNEDINSDLIRRYEDMLRCGERRYFDAEDIEDIAYEYELSEQYRDALGVIEYGLELHPGNIDLLVRRAGYLLCLDRIDEAERQIDEIHSHTADALLIQTEIALIRSDFVRAMAYIDDLLDSDELSLEICLDVIDLFLDYDCFSEAFSFIDEACRRLPKDKDALMRELAHIYEDQQKNDEAIAIYNKLLDKDPYSHADWFDLARLLALRGKYDEAIEACDFALAIDENNVETMISKGCCLYDKGDFQAAMHLFDEVIDTAQDKSLAHAMLAACYSHMELYEKAVNSLLLAIKYADYPNADFYYQLATNYYSLNDISNTRDALTKALEADAYHVDAMMFVGEIDMSENKLEAAEKQFRLVLTLDPENAYACKNLAQIMERLALSSDGENRTRYCHEAIEYYTRAVEYMHHTDVEMLLSLALAHFKYGDVEEAMHLADRIESLMNDPEILNNLDDENRSRIESLAHIMDLLRDELGKNLNTNL
ncbi:putative uncharacterized protein [Bacteroides sp. CAG:144]|nr:putative uncharacterized protein [Bacteroides sp. CAG:144]